MLARAARALRASEGWLNLVGGCCGTTPAHIRALAATVARAQAARACPVAPRARSSRASTSSRSTTTTARCSSASAPTSSAAASSSELIADGQVRGGRARSRRAQVQERRADHRRLPARTRTATRSPTCDAFLERADPEGEGAADDRLDRRDGASSAALTCSQGKAIINSINLEDGEERFETVVPLAQPLRRGAGRRHDRRGPEQGMARHARSASSRSRGAATTLLTEKYGVPAEDIIFDPLVFPCGTGDEKYVGSAVETIEGIRADQGGASPSRKTILGISNVSLRPAGGRARGPELGLPLPLRRRPGSTSRSSTPRSSSATRRSPRRSGGSPRTCSSTAAPTRSPPSPPTSAGEGARRRRRPSAPATAARRAAAALHRRGLEGRADRGPRGRARCEACAPLDIINGPLMDGHGRGRPALQRQRADRRRGAAARRGDEGGGHPPRAVHGEDRDALARARSSSPRSRATSTTSARTWSRSSSSNNGYEVVNLGIKVPPEQLIAARAASTGRTSIGLSGLLVKSAQQMVTTARGPARARASTLPILVGGAALVAKLHATSSIAPAYGGARRLRQGRDERASTLANRICRTRRARERSTRELARAPRERSRRGAAPSAETPLARAGGAQRERARGVDAVPRRPTSSAHVLDATLDLDEVWPYVNPQMLYGKHLGLQGSCAQAARRGGRPEGRRRSSAGRSTR